MSHNCLNDLPICHVANAPIDTPAKRVAPAEQVSEHETMQMRSLNQDGNILNSLNNVVGGVNPNNVYPFVHDTTQRRNLKREAPEHDNCFDDVDPFSADRASGSSFTLLSAFTRIDDAHSAARCRSRVHAPGFQGGTSRKRHKLRDINSDLCMVRLPLSYDSRQSSDFALPVVDLASGDAQSSANSRCTLIERSSNHVCSTGLSGSTERHKHAAASNDAVLSPDAPT